MIDPLRLLEAARAMASETVEADVARVAVESAHRLLGAEQAGWITWVDETPVVATVVPGGEGAVAPGAGASAGGLGPRTSRSSRRWGRSSSCRSATWRCSRRWRRSWRRR